MSTPPPLPKLLHIGSRVQGSGSRVQGVCFVCCYGIIYSFSLLLRYYLLFSWCACSPPPTHTQVRIIVERLARRVGFDEVAAVMPADHAKLLTHIRKERSRRDRRR